MTKKEPSKAHLSELKSNVKDLIAKFEELRGYL